MSPAKPIWLDTNVLIDYQKGKVPPAEVEIINDLQRDGHEMLVTPSAEREFLWGARVPGDTARLRDFITRRGFKVDTMANMVSKRTLSMWRDVAHHHGLSIADADIIAEIRASAWVRGIRNPVFLTGDAGGTLLRMRQRGVLATEFRAHAIRSQIPLSRPKPPQVGFLRGRLSANKAAIEEALTAENIAAGIAAAIVELTLIVADGVATKEAIREIEIKFLKEGFAKGVAAGVMGWTEAEVQLNLKNHVTDFRVQGLGDPAGALDRASIFKLAEACENYAVDIGFQFSYSKTNKWKQDMRAKGFDVLNKYGYHWPTDTERLFEYDFIHDLAWVLHPTTDSIVEPAIRFYQERPAAFNIMTRLTAGG
jgi:hypothetical protein